MRYSYPPIAGKILFADSNASSWSIIARTLFFGLPLIGGILLAIFWFTGRISEDMINRAIARTTRLQALAVSHEFERILDETRNQLLILAAGPMDKSDMIRRLKIRPMAESSRYRELAFLGVSPENRFLLLNYGGEVVAVPDNVARESRLSPFQSFAVERRPGHVVLSDPMEVVYPMVPVHGVVQSLSLHVMRMTTPVYGTEGSFLGLLILSLDLTTLRDTLSVFSSSKSPIYDPTSDISKSRSMFFDAQGWVLFQSENPDVLQTSLSTDGVRSGLRGDFGRPGFSIAFRPAPEHEDFWYIVSEIQSGRSGHALIRSRLSVVEGQSSHETASYAPLRFRGSPDGAPVVVGGVATTDTSIASNRSGFHLLGVYAICSLVGLFCMAVALYYMGRWLARPINALAQAVREEGEAAVPSRLQLSAMPSELGLVQDEINLLLERIKAMQEETVMREAAVNAQWQRQPMPFPALQNSEPNLGIVGNTPIIHELRIHILKAAAVPADVLLIGETGTGKEMAADAIHRQSDRSTGPFISINCGALDENLLMDTLFGHVKGAFTEARTDRKGAFLAAEGGTLMLDEIANASPKVQQALLRALAVRRIRPLGSDREISFNLRIIAATNEDLLQLAKDNLFREDLFYRLAVITIKTPPLREHKEDIPQLAQHFLHIAAKEQGTVPPLLSKGAMDRLVNYSWPGNVRELCNVLVRAMAFTEGTLIYAEAVVFGDTTLPRFLPPDAGPPPVGAASATGSAKLAESPTSTPGLIEDKDEAVPREPTPGVSMPPFKIETMPDTLNPRQKAALPAILAAGGVSRQEYQSMVGGTLSMRSAQYDLQEMVRIGILVKQGRGPALRYVVTRTAPTSVHTQFRSGQ